MHVEQSSLGLLPANYNTSKIKLNVHKPYCLFPSLRHINSGTKHCLYGQHLLSSCFGLALACPWGWSFASFFVKKVNEWVDSITAFNWKPQWIVVRKIMQWVVKFSLLDVGANYLKSAASMGIHCFSFFRPKPFAVKAFKTRYEKNFHLQFLSAFSLSFFFFLFSSIFCENNK